MPPSAPTADDPDAPAHSPPRVLVAHDDVGTCRLVRETLGQFGSCAVDTSPTAEYAYELALGRPYALYMFGLSLPVLHGELLYELLFKAHALCLADRRPCPGVVYIADAADAGRAEELKREARVKGVLVKPLSIDRILDRVRGTIPLRDVGAQFE